MLGRGCDARYMVRRHGHVRGPPARQDPARPLALHNKLGPRPARTVYPHRRSVTAYRPSPPTHTPAPHHRHAFSRAVSNASEMAPRWVDGWYRARTGSDRLRVALCVVRCRCSRRRYLGAAHRGSRQPSALMQEVGWRTRATRTALLLQGSQGLGRAVLGQQGAVVAR
jgi:hypothetical protein